MRIEHGELKHRLTKLKETIGHDSSCLLKLQRRNTLKEKSKTWAMSHQMKACLQHQNDLSTAAIRKDFSDTLRAMGRETSQHLHVFPVAASLHMRYKGETTIQPIPGFPDFRSTGIGALRNWLTTITLPERDGNAQSFLTEVDAFYAGVQPWANDRHGDIKMSVEQREMWQTDLDLKIASLEQVIILPHCVTFILRPPCLMSMVAIYQP